MKKAQITLFVIISLVVIISVILFFLIYTNDDTIDLPKTSEDITIPIKNYVEDCLNDALIKSFFVILMHGGHLDDFNHYHTNDIFNVLVYVDDLEKKFPSIEYIQNELSIIIKQETELCLNHFSNFFIQGYQIYYDELNVETMITLNDVIVNLNMPTEIILNDKSSRLFSYNIRNNFNFQEKYNLVESIVDNYIENDGFLDLVFIEKLSIENDFNYEFIPVDEGVYIISLIFSDVIYDFRPLIYNFKVIFNEN